MKNTTRNFLQFFAVKKEERNWAEFLFFLAIFIFTFAMLVIITL